MRTRVRKLAEAIATSVDASECSAKEAVEVLLTLAAGRAATSGSHTCQDFRSFAHGVYHKAEDEMPTEPQTVH